MSIPFENKGWIIEQRWRDVLFLHYKIDPGLIKNLVPFRLDLHDGEAVISIVPFLMEGIRFPYLPSIPIVSRLWELNIRTYVEVDGVKGVYFFTLETDSKLGEFVARYFFHLPYHFSHIKAEVNDKTYEFSHHRNEFSFKIKATILENIETSSFDTWATERYSLFTQKNEESYQGIVQHAPWQLQRVKIDQIEDQFTTMVTTHNMKFEGASFSKYLKVRFMPFIKKKSSINLNK